MYIEYTIKYNDYKTVPTLDLLHVSFLLVIPLNKLLLWIVTLSCLWKMKSWLTIYINYQHYRCVPFTDKHYSWVYYEYTNTIWTQQPYRWWVYIEPVSGVCSCQFTIMPRTVVGRACMAVELLFNSSSISTISWHVLCIQYLPPFNLRDQIPTVE